MKQRTTNRVIGVVLATSVAALVLFSTKAPLVESFLGNGTSGNGCIAQLQLTAKCRNTDRAVIFRDARGHETRLKDGDKTCFGGVLVSVKPLDTNANISEVRFDEVNPVNPPVVMKVHNCEWLDVVGKE
ncbi:MAG: hypothetical protein V1492_05065 [Candidatus Micrarchaeota archaeon]